MPGAVETGRAIAHAWMCDHMGHMNTRFYAAIFDDAGFQLLEEIAPQAELAPNGRGWADVSLTITLKQEVAPGTALLVMSQVIRIGTTSISCRHYLTSAKGAATHATADVVTVLFDLKRRKAVPIDGALRSRAGELLAAAEPNGGANR